MHNDIVPVLVVGGGPVGLALAGDLGWRGIACTLVEQSDGSIYQPRMDLVGVRTMEFCRRWGIVPAVEGSPYPRDYAQDNIYLTSLTGYELGRERFPGIGQAPPPKESPQRRERCPQNMFDPILRAFAASQKNVALRYRTRLVSFTQNADLRHRGDRKRRDRRARGNSGALHRRLRRRAQPGARDARHRDAGQSGADLHHQRDLPLPAPALAARQGQSLPPHLHRPGRHLVDHRRHQRPRRVALFHHRRRRAARLHRPTTSRRRSAAPSAAISSSRF